MNCVWLKMDSLDGVGVVLFDVAPVVGLGAVAPVVGAVPFCWAHSLKTGSAWIGFGLYWIVLYWTGIR